MLDINVRRYRNFSLMILYSTLIEIYWTMVQIIQSIYLPIFPVL